MSEIDSSRCGDTLSAVQSLGSVPQLLPHHYFIDVGSPVDRCCMRPICPQHTKSKHSTSGDRPNSESLIFFSSLLFCLSLRRFTHIKPQVQRTTTPIKPRVQRTTTQIKSRVQRTTTQIKPQVQRTFILSSLLPLKILHYVDEIFFFTYRLQVARDDLFFSFFLFFRVISRCIFYRQY